MDGELERFKAEISLTDYAQARGYELQPRESSQHSKVLKAGADKIIVTRQPDGHDVYFNVHDERDGGSIIDFAQKRGRGNLGQVRKELRGWMPDAKRPAPQRPEREPERPKPVTRDSAEVLRKWAELEPYTRQYLSDVRGIEPRVIEAFGVRQDGHGNACIPHQQSGGVVCGWETKNRGFAGFVGGGERNVSWSRLDDVRLSRIVVTESGIDAMSYAQLHHQPGTAYVSTGGTGLSARQREQLTELLARGVPVVMASDADTAGDRFAQEVARLRPAGARVLRARPTQGKDWNEALQAHVAAQEAQRQEAQRVKNEKDHSGPTLG